jgi:hypothetical protein
MAVFDSRDQEKPGRHYCGDDFVPVRPPQLFCRMLGKQLRAVEKELERLTVAVTTGGELSMLVQAIRERGCTRCSCQLHNVFVVWSLRGCGYDEGIKR